MAGSMASPQPSGVGGGDDPFVSTSNTHGSKQLRYSTLDPQIFSFGPGTSAEQAKRALQAHLAETNRKLEEVGKSGTALVEHRRQIEEQMKEVEHLQAEEEVPPELKKTLVNLERDYSEVTRETSRTLLPKQRIPSNEAAAGSPFAPEGKGGRRSVSPSKFESQATGSPTKLSVPNRKLRNQPANRIHDIEFAAEISTSLISQVRNLQSLLAERDEELRDIKVEKSKLELEAENFQQRVKNLDENEHRYKDENWNLETQLHELIASQKDAAEREKKLTQALNVLQAEKNSTQRELDEIKATHSKLVDEHAASVKHHDIELGTVKRNMVMAESERSAMQRKIEDLTSQNQELARAFSTQRGRTLERDSNLGMSDEDFEAAADNVTPEHSPPPSPVKGTPRHPMLESETLKTSLHHAQRTIQGLRANNHREKTEKLELKRIVQDLRDEMERMRGDPSNNSSRRNRKVDSREFKKPMRLGQLGGARSSRSDIYLDDPDWEDQVGEPSSPSRPPALRNTPLLSGEMPTLAESSDHFETAHETSDGAFETANDERATETEDFQTGAEEMSDEDGATETEDASRGLGRLRRPPSLGLGQSRGRYSYHSTASTSADEDDYSATSIKTPTATLPSQKMRLRLSRGNLSSRRSRQGSEEPTFRSSPASFAASSVSGTPQAAGQSLFAELGDFDGSDDESMAATPSRRSVRSMTPGSVAPRMRSPPPEVPPLPRAVMVDSGMMTDPVDVRIAASGSPGAVVTLGERPLSMDSVIAVPGRDPGTSWLETRDQDDQRSRPLSTSTFAYSDAGAQHDPGMDEELARFPSPPTSPPQIGALPTPILAPPISLSISRIQAEGIEPVRELEAPPPTPPILSISDIQTEQVEPISEPAAPLPALSISKIQAEHVTPASDPELSPAALSLSGIWAEHVEPVSEPEVPPAAPPALSLSSIQVEDIEPRAEPEALHSPSTSFNLSAIHVAEIEPFSEPETPLPAPTVLTISAIRTEHVEPRGEPEPPSATHHVLSISGIIAEEVLPVVEPELGAASASPVGLVALAADEALHAKPERAPATLEHSGIRTQYEVAPTESEELEVALPARESLSLSAIYAQDVEPIASIEPALAFSRVYGVTLEPRTEPEDPVPLLALSPIHGQTLEPRAGPEPLAPVLAYSQIVGQELEPCVEPGVPAPVLTMSTIAAEDVEPASLMEPPLQELSLSSISTEQVAPIEPTERGIARPPLGFSAVFTSVDTRPIPRSPKRNGFILPRDDDMPRTPISGMFAIGRGKGKGKAPESPIIAEDETRQSPSGSPMAETPESQRPLRELSSNPNAKPLRKKTVLTADQGAQTSLTADVIDQILQLRTKTASPDQSHQRSDSFGTSVGTPGTVRIRRSHESIGSVIRHKVKLPDGAAAEADLASARRPGSAASRSSFQAQALPPLPSNHRQAIEAARTNSSGGGNGTIGTIGTMGPPLLPASAYKNSSFRPRTPSGSNPLSPVSVTSGRGTPTPKAVRSNSAHGTAEVYTPSRITARSRQSSISSFASEVDARFNMQNGMSMGQETHGFGPNTDPRMIQAITQTMIGEYLWKYTRKAGRGEMSENRHRRYFWVHPYTRTLYWSDRDPSMAGRSELRAKSVPIEAVRVVTDDNPMPPGLHRKSLVILSPGRTIKFTCTTGQRHETWFNALSYLLLRTDAEGQADNEEIAEHITSEDVDEFNPQIGRRPVMGTRASTRPAPSLSSYNSRTTRNESPAMINVSLDVPTLTPSPHKKKEQRPSLGTLSRLSGYWRSSQLGSLRSRSVGAQDRAIYEASEVHDSAEDLRVMYEAQDREAARLENVRACCDGKHDVATLTKRGSHATHTHTHSHTHNHTHPGPSTTPTPMGTVGSRA